MEKQPKKYLIRLFEKWSGKKAIQFSPLPPSGSYRQYFRISGKEKSAIGVYNEDVKENIAFLSLTKHFFKKGLNVPEIYSEDIKKNIYLIQDLGNKTLYKYLSETRKNRSFPSNAIKIYKKVIEILPQFQITGDRDLDYSVCYPRSHFDKQSMMWDLSYFKHYFLKLVKIPFDEQKLEDDFQNFSDYLLKADRHFFLYRDFQSANIMLLNNDLYFIDYQGGRKGALQYDLASLLFEAKTDIPFDIKNELLEHYLNNLSKYNPYNRDEFIRYYFGYALIRLMQAFGAFGFRGFYEKKPLFLQSIPNAIKNLEWLLKEITFSAIIPTLYMTLEQLVVSQKIKEKTETGNKLKVYINSFSFYSGTPTDDLSNEGGFVFDCRSVPNPGKYKKYQEFTGQDKVVQDFFRNKKEVDEFLHNIFALVDQSIKKYQKQNASKLMVSFGCTGGQHRSVYSAERLVQHLKKKYDVEIILRHRELEG